MKKITELTEVKYKTIHFKDAFGNRHREQEEYLGTRAVRSIKTGPRFAHYLIDLIIFYIITYLFSFLLGISVGIISQIIPHFGSFIDGVGGIFILLLYPIYYFALEASFQTTIGKLVTQSVVIDEYGNKPTVRIFILRSISRIVPFESLSCLGDDYSYGWHDKWSNTWVVSKSELAEIRRLQNEQQEIIHQIAK